SSNRRRWTHCSFSVRYMAIDTPNRRPESLLDRADQLSTLHSSDCFFARAAPAWPRQRPPAGPELGTCTAPTRPRALTRRLHGGLGLIPHPRLDLRRCQVDLTARLRDCAPTSMISHYQCHLPPRGPTLDFLTNHHAHWL